MPFALHSWCATEDKMLDRSFMCRFDQIPGPVNVNGKKSLFRNTPFANLCCQMINYLSILYGFLEGLFIGDIAINTYNLLKSVDIIEQEFDKILQHNCIPLTLGGDHTITLPILRAIARKHGPVGLVHVDAHTDVNDEMFGEKIAHGTTFRRAFEENLIDGNRVVQIGVRGSGYAAEDFDWGRNQGFRVIQAEECWHKSLTPLMKEVRQQVGNSPVYISFDIDGIDPAYAPGTGTVEVGGLTTIQALEIIRGCQDLNIVGGDLVEVSPPYDTSGNTALLGANLLFEMLCVLPRVK